MKSRRVIRKHKLTAMLSREEQRLLCEIANVRGFTVSALIRLWIWHGCVVE